MSSYRALLEVLGGGVLGILLAVCVVYAWDRVEDWIASRRRP